VWSGHPNPHLVDRAGRLHRGRARDHGRMRYTADEVAALLDPGAWQVVLADAPARTATTPDGRTRTVHDARLQARRRD
jgi:hypothetical protein